ncbi:uncharacterized protein LOC130692067 isoform X2 [Daphnia carinata]|uniref:uncharacterized protein LOC130692067 isoform X2 n=1 Tax=Daphnia carinata TaxID=120202 RepID=UPI0025798A67|nr:uncharacterized protein LOC130692067 isoform X2 [Daphnia carinata]
MTNETERKKELVGEPRLSYGASGASATCIATRASGAELIRQLSYHKLNQYYQSDETLHQFSGTAVSKRKSANPTSIVKRFSDNQYDYQYQKHRQTTAGSTRPRLLRQSTTHSESVAGTSSAGPNSGPYNRRRLLADTREQRSWRSCDASHHDVPQVLAATHLLGGSGGVRTRHDSVAKSDDMTPSFLDLSSSSCSMHRQSVTPRPSPVGSHQGRLDRHYDKVDEDEDETQQRKDGELLDEQVRYTKRPAEGANGLDEDCVVLPPLATIGTRLVVARKSPNAELVVLSPEPMLADAGLRQAVKTNVVSNQPINTANKKKKKVRRSRATADGSKTAPVKAAASAIAAVAVVTVGVANKTSFSSSDESNNPRRRARGIVILTSVFLLFTCLFMVGITLRLAPLIDDLVRKENELQTFTSVSSNGDMINGTASNNVFSPQQTGQLGTILNSTTTTAATPSIIALLAASNSSTMNLT